MPDQLASVCGKAHSASGRAWDEQSLADHMRQCPYCQRKQRGWYVEGNTVVGRGGQYRIKVEVLNPYDKEEYFLRNVADFFEERYESWLD